MKSFLCLGVINYAASCGRVETKDSIADTADSAADTASTDTGYEPIEPVTIDEAPLYLATAPCSAPSIMVIIPDDAIVLSVNAIQGSAEQLTARSAAGISMWVQTPGKVQIICQLGLTAAEISYMRPE